MRTQGFSGLIAVVILLQLESCFGQLGFLSLGGGAGIPVPTKIHLPMPKPIGEDASPPSPASYYVSFPTILRPGTTHRVSVRLLNEGNMSTVSVSLRNSSNASVALLETQPYTITADGISHIFSLEIPHSLEKPRWPDAYELHVVGSGDINFNESRELKLDEKTFAIFVQTDKAKYKPGQTVRFRVLAMYFNKTVMREPMDIVIRDRSGNTIKQWKNVQGVHNTGVIERNFPLSSFAALGRWSIQATVMGYSETKQFEVDKYVLPKFEAMVDVPTVIPTSEPALRGKAMAKYTFGKPLTDAKVLVTVEYPHFHNPYDNRTKPTLTQVGVLDRNGEMLFEFYKKDLLDLTWKQDQPYAPDRETLSLSWRTLKVVANVVDVRTGKSMQAETLVKFLDNKAEIDFLPTTPNSFKPGLKYFAHVKVRKVDNTLFENYNNINVTFNVTYNVPVTTTTTTTTTTSTTTVILDTKVNQTMEGSLPDSTVPTPEVAKVDGGIRYPWNTPVTTIVLAAFNKTLTANGFLSVELDIPSNATMLELSVSVLGDSFSQQARRAMSPSENFLQIQQRTRNPKTGQRVSFDVKTTEAVENVTYQLYSKGAMLTETTAPAVDTDNKLFNITFSLTANMAPNCRILAFYIRPDGEVVADSISFKVDLSAEHQVSLSYNHQKVKPGEDVELTVSARPNSVVFLLGVDKSATLFKSDNDITNQKVDERLAMLDFGALGTGPWRIMAFCGWPLSFGGTDAFHVFMEANVAFVTDGRVFGEYSKGRRIMTGTGEMMLAKGSGNTDVRHFFPEVWLFSAVIVGDDGQAVVQKTAPHTITTWLTSAFAVHPDYGLSVVEKPAELITFKNIFVSLDLPYSAIRGEDLCMKAFAYNYHETPLYMRLVMGRSKGISNIRLIRTSRQSKNRVEYRAPMRVSHRIGKVKPNEIGETTFCFTPSTLGHMPIQVNLTTSVAGDGVERMLLVEAEGVPRTQNFPVILDVDGDAEFLQVVPVTFPKDVVNGSQRIRVSLAGDLLGPVLDNIDDLLRMPYGCGEQNMLYFAPNVFLIDYLQKTGTYTQEVAEKAEHYMLVGYQKEITYQHTDGSYSTFGQKIANGTSGSMWLTAFVTKCFVQSMALPDDVVSIDPHLVLKSLRWMISKQLKNGSFPEPGRVFNKNMQGGSAKGEALTAYVIIALAEAEATFEDLDQRDLLKLRQAISKGQEYLEQQLTSLNDSYDLAIVTYALHLTSSSNATNAFNLLQEYAIAESFSVHWERPKPDASDPHYYWQRTTDAINIEMTAYALLTYIHRADVTGALPIVRWLTNQRGPQGGFISTQDTVIGLQALAQIATELYQPTFTPITVTVGWSVDGRQETRTLTLDDSNRLLLQKVDVPIERNRIPADITIRANIQAGTNFSGMAAAEVTFYYNVLNPTALSTYHVTPRVKVIDENSFVLEVSAARVDGKTGGMTVLEVGVPTGYTVDAENSAYSVLGSSIAEAEDRKFILYYDEMGDNPVTAVLPMNVTNGIPVNTQPMPIRVYDYYESGGEQEMTVNYELPQVDFICDRQPKYESCPYIRA